jgi:hypothetical protein
MKKDDRIFATVGACVVSAEALAAALMWLGSGITVDAPQRATVDVLRRLEPATETSLSDGSQAVEVEAPDVEDDGPLRAAMMHVSAHPVLASYLANDRLLRRFVMAVDAVAGGYSPSDQIEFLSPGRPFVVREDGGRLVVAPGTYRRYDLVGDVFASLDSEAMADVYRRFSARLDAIYHEVGWADDAFDNRMREAIDHLLEVEVPIGQIEVEQRAIVYAYADDHFENLTDAQKHLLRVGPRNARKIQSKLREFRTAMAWPEPAPAAVTTKLELTEEAGITDKPMIAVAVPVEKDAGEMAEASESP